MSVVYNKDIKPGDLVLIVSEETFAKRVEETSGYVLRREVTEYYNNWLKNVTGKVYKISKIENDAGWPKYYLKHNDEYISGSFYDRAIQVIIRAPRKENYDE